MQYFLNLEHEIKIIIFKYVNNPLNLTLSCRNWSIIAKDPYVKADWLMVRYEKAHALFHAVRLGPTFIDIPLCQALIARNATVSRYFIQRLLIHFVKYDQELLDLKIEHNVGQHDDRDLQKIRSPWSSNLPMSVFTRLLGEGYRQLSDAHKDLLPKENGLIHFFSDGPHYSPRLLRKKRFTPFPPSLQLRKSPWGVPVDPSKNGKIDKLKLMNRLKRGLSR